MPKKKPDPAIYNLAKDKLGLRPERTLCRRRRQPQRPARGQNCGNAICIVTKSAYTQDEDFTEADLVVSELGDPPNVQVDLATIRRIVENGGGRRP